MNVYDCVSWRFFFTFKITSISRLGGRANHHNTKKYLSISELRSRVARSLLLSDDFLLFYLLYTLKHQVLLGQTVNWMVVPKF